MEASKEVVDILDKNIRKDYRWKYRLNKYFHILYSIKLYKSYIKYIFLQNLCHIVIL